MRAGLRGGFNNANGPSRSLGVPARILFNQLARTSLPDMVAQGEAATWRAFLFVATPGREKEIETERACPAGVRARCALAR
jgi:hypothetical protein